MAKFVRTFTKRVFIIATIVAVFFFLLACANFYLNPRYWWFIAIIGLAFPFLLLLVVSFVVFWLIFRSRWVILPLLTLFIGFTNIRAFMGVHFFTSFNNQKDSNSIRLLTWNVSWFDEQRKDGTIKKPGRKQMLEFVQKQNADILCFQEFLETNLSGPVYNNVEEITAMGYPYNYWVGDYIKRQGKYIVGAAIFSKYPILAHYQLNYSGTRKERAAESLIAVDLEVHEKKIRVFTTHLQSIQLNKEDYHNLEIIKSADDSLMMASKSIVRKLKTGYNFRGSQSETVRQQLDQSPYPEIICGDFNDVPNSYTYATIKGNRQDAFIEAGSGIGATFKNIAPTLRIDYIMVNKKLRVVQSKRMVVPFSDHNPVMADLQWR
ncbi:MAG: endonuclease/exonuclease/phosphatase family protein [Chitinophagaceae bacterium]